MCKNCETPENIIGYMEKPEVPPMLTVGPCVCSLCVAIREATDRLHVTLADRGCKYDCSPESCTCC